MSCEFYKRLAEGPLARVAKGKWEHLIKAIKLLVGAISPASSGVSPPSLLVEAVELAVDLFKRGFARELVELAKVARNAGQCDEEVKRAAERLGVSEEWLRTLAKNLASLPEVDIAKLEERARALERGLNSLKLLSPHLLDLTQLFVEEGGRLLVRSPFGVVEYVEVGVEGRVREALSRGHVAVIYGPRGVGKSTTALKAIYDFAKTQLGRAVVVVRVGENWRENLWAAVQLRDGLFVPVLYYDTLEAGGYARSGEGVGVLYGAMAHVKPLADFLHDAALLRVPTVVVLTEEDYRAYEEVAMGVGAEVVRLGGEAEALVRGILRGAPDSIAQAVLEKYKDELYAVAAALAKALYEKWNNPASVAKAVKRLDVHSLVLAYLWHVVLGGSEIVARWVVPLILATGFFGPHPPKLAKAVVKAFGGVPVSRVIEWLSQPLPEAVYTALRKVAHGAAYRRFGVGGDELCQGSGEGPCRLVEICSETLVGVPRKRYSEVEEVTVEYAKLVAKALRAFGPAEVRQIDLLIDDFLQAFDGVAEDGHWRIEYENYNGEAVEEVVDELDVLSALYGVAVLPGWDPQLEPLKEWFFVGGKKVETTGQYLFPFLREGHGELVKMAVAIVQEAETWGFANVDFWRAVGIAAAGQWDSASDEELEKAVELTAFALDTLATAALPIILDHVKSLLSEAWRRVISGGTHGDGDRCQRLADRLTQVAYNIANGHPRSLPLFFAIGVDKPNPEAVSKRFDVLYNVASDAGKLQLLDTLFYALGWNVGGVNVAAVLLGNPQHGLREVFEEVAKRVEDFVSRLNGVVRAYAIAYLYPGLAVWHTSFSEFDKAVEVAEETLKALEELWKAYVEDKVSTEETLRPYLELKQVKPDLGKELNDLSTYVYYHVARVYRNVDELDKAVEYAEKACELAKKLGDVYYEVLSCGLSLRLKAVRSGAPSVEEFEEVWQRALQVAEWLDAGAIAAALGRYVVALASADRLGDVEKALEKWGWALESAPVALTLTYGVLSLFDERHLEKAMRYLPEGARSNLPKFANALHDAVETGLFAKKSEIAKSAVEKLLVYGGDIVKALFEVARRFDRLFLLVLVGLAYCKRGEEWGLKLAREAAQAGSQLFKDRISGPLFGDLYKALEGVKADDCITKEVLKAVYKLYYYHV